MSWVRELPWRAIRKAGYGFRRVFATKDTPKRKHLLVDEDIEGLETLLRKENFRSGWLLSYHYKGEDGNLSRAEYEYGDLSEKQLHIRLFEEEEGQTVIYTHYEMCPIEHPRKHLNGAEQSVDIGHKMTKEILDKHNIGYIEAGRGEEV